METIAFTPSADTAAALHHLLDIFERRASFSGGRAEPDLPAPGRRHAIRVTLAALGLPSYFSQIDPGPRQTTNEQFQQLSDAGLVKLTWLPNQAGHLLESVSLVPECAEAIFRLLGRPPIASQRARLADLLRGERFRFPDWRLQALQRTLEQLRQDKSPAPFSLADHEFNQDLLVALAALDSVVEETPCRVFSVRVFNDSKRFDDLSGAMALLARRHQPGWRDLSHDEALRELNLVANPGHLYLSGPWQLVDEEGQVLSLGEFRPSAGLPATQASRLRRVAVSAPGVICVENPTAFYELIRAAPIRPEAAPLAAICLWGNPSPACRHLLRCLPTATAIRVWADLDYGGLNILAQVREQVNAEAAAYLMDRETFEAHARWARPLTPADVKHLQRLLQRPCLADMQPLIRHMLQRGLKLEQEAIDVHQADGRLV